MMVGMKVIIAMIIIVMMNDLAKEIVGLTWWQPVRRLSIERVPLHRNLERSNINIDVATNIDTYPCANIYKNINQLTKTLALTSTSISTSAENYIVGAILSLILKTLNTPPSKFPPFKPKMYFQG